MVTTVSVVIDEDITIFERLLLVCDFGLETLDIIL